MQEIISYFNSNSTAVIAVASAITAVATIFIARFTYVSSRILKWDKEKDRRNRQPVLVLVDEITEGCAYFHEIGADPAWTWPKLLGRPLLPKEVQPCPSRPLPTMWRSCASCQFLAQTAYLYTSAKEGGKALLEHFR